MHLYIKERHLTVAIVDIVKLLEAKKVKMQGLIKGRVTQCLAPSWELYHRKGYTQICPIIILQIEKY